MNRKLIEKYFQDQCSPEELKQVLDWFQSPEGQAFLREDIDLQSQKLSDDAHRFLYPRIDSEGIFSRIQKDKKRGLSRSNWFRVRVAAILVITGLLSSLAWWNGFISYKEKAPEPSFISYVTQEGQQKVFTLSDGTTIRLNENSSLWVPAQTVGGKRTVTLQGEAYFEVTHDEDNPFVVYAMGAEIEDLGTRFNIKAETGMDAVQVAVLEGKVALKSEKADNDSAALLTPNHFGMLRLSDGQITIEQTNVQNYIGWINNRLVFDGENLAQVSRQLERLYNVDISFKSAGLKQLSLTADIEKADIQTVLNTISKAFDIHYKMDGRTVSWHETMGNRQRPVNH